MNHRICYNEYYSMDIQKCELVGRAIPYFLPGAIIVAADRK